MPQATNLASQSATRSNGWTEGPWAADGATVRVDGGRVALALGQSMFRNDPEQEANAHLIAAAPCLYEALEHYCNRYLLDELEDAELCWDADHHRSIKAMFAALSRARGEA